MAQTRVGPLRNYYGWDSMWQTIIEYEPCSRSVLEANKYSVIYSSEVGIIILRDFYC